MVSPDSPASAPASPLMETLLQHFDQIVLPLWTGPGWNAAMHLPYEALAIRDQGQAAPVLPVQRYRAMACARQLYVFSLHGNSGHADRLFQSLCEHFEDTRHGGWYYSIDANGQPLDARKDLYTHAFVIFACAEYFRRWANPKALAVVAMATNLIETHFATSPGLYAPMLAQDLGQIDAGLLQNPIMHLTEAYLAAWQASGEAAYVERLRHIAKAVAQTFVDGKTGCIAELPLHSAANRVEPGHQFEWYALLSFAPEIFADSQLPVALERAFDFAERYGVAADCGVAAALDMDGGMQDASQRIWAQTEYGRALHIRQRHASQARVERWQQQFQRRFIHAQGWHEVLAPSGEVLRAEMPSTTPYHLATAWRAFSPA